MTIKLIFENYPKPNINMLGDIKESIPYFLQINNQYKIENIETAKKTDNWVYPIAVKNPILEKDVFINGSKFNSNFFARKINEDILHLVSQGKGWICLDFTEEPISNQALTHFINYIERIKETKLKKDNLDKVLNRTIILTTQLKSSMHPYINHDQVFSLSCRRENEITVLESKHMPWIIGEPKLSEQSQVTDNRVYSFFNYDYLSDQVRFSSLALLQKLNLLEFGHISLFEQGKDYDEYYHDYCTIYNKQKLNITFTHNHKVHGLLDVKDTLTKSYINLVIEACYERTELDTLYITEKTFRNYYLKKPFLLIGQPETLAALKDLGYKSFHPYINEEYDETVNGAVRLRMIFNELKRLCSFTEKDWKEFHSNVYHILEHNYNVNTKVRPKTSYKIFKEYING